MPMAVTFASCVTEFLKRVTGKVRVAHAVTVIGGPFRGSEARARGLVTADELRGPRFRRLFPDVYLPADRGPDLVTRSRAAFLMVEGLGGVLAGYSAAALLNADCAPLDTPAEVIVPRPARAHPGLRITRGNLPEHDVTMRRDCRVTTPERTAWDLARRLPFVEAVVAMDALAHGRTFRPTDLLARKNAQPNARGSARLGVVVDLSDPRAESPMETRLRLGLIRAGLPKPHVQYQVCNTTDHVVARVDLAYPAAKLALEYDGELHDDPLVRERDRLRDHDLGDLGWRVMHLRGPDVLRTMEHTVARVRAWLARRLGTFEDPLSPTIGC